MMTDKRVNAESVKEWLKNQTLRAKSGYDVEAELTAYLDALPEAVVRCKNCRYYRKFICNLLGTDKDPEGYCDEGLKRPAEEEK